MTPIGWDKETCAFCGTRPEMFDSEGRPPGVYIVIRIDMPDPQLPPEYAYTEMAMCKACWLEMGIEPAFEHNREIRACAGVVLEDVKEEKDG